VVAMAGFRGMLGVLPAALVAGLSFAIPQFLVSNYHGPWLVDIIASISSIVAVIVLLRFWKPKTIWKMQVDSESIPVPEKPTIIGTAKLAFAWMPWLLLA